MSAWLGKANSEVRYLLDPLDAKQKGWLLHWYVLAHWANADEEGRLAIEDDLQMMVERVKQK